MTVAHAIGYCRCEKLLGVRPAATGFKGRLCGRCFGEINPEATAAVDALIAQRGDKA